MFFSSFYTDRNIEQTKERLEKKLFLFHDHVRVGLKFSAFIHTCFFFYFALQNYSFSQYILFIFFYNISLLKCNFLDWIHPKKCFYSHHFWNFMISTKWHNTFNKHLLWCYIGQNKSSSIVLFLMSFFSREDFFCHLTILSSNNPNEFNIAVKS